MTVSAILSQKGRQVVTMGPKQPLREVCETLTTHKIGAVVLIDAHGRIAGILSERDIVRWIGEKGASVLGKPASELMTKNVITCSEANSLEEMMGVMTQGRFRHVPVVVDGQLAGIISIGDVVKHHIAEVELEVTAMREYLATG